MNNKKIFFVVLLLIMAFGTPQYVCSQGLSGLIKDISAGIKERKELKKMAKLIAEQEKKEAELKAEKEKKEAELKAEKERKMAELREQFTLQNSKLLENKKTETRFKMLLNDLPRKEKRELSPQEINNELLLRLNENLERVYGVSNAEEDEIRDIVNEEKEKEIKE